MSFRMLSRTHILSWPCSLDPTIWVEGRGRCDYVLLDSGRSSGRESYEQCAFVFRSMILIKTRICLSLASTHSYFVTWIINAGALIHSDAAACARSETPL